MARVKRPEFSWWPYRAVALAVPLLALGAAVGAGIASTRVGDAQTQEVMTVFFAVLGAGNAYLFAIAIGDLGKTILAVPAGGFAGFLAVQIFGHPPATVIYLILLGILTIHAMLNGIFRALVGCGGLFLMFIGGAVAANFRKDFEPGLSVICAYPFVCGAVAAFMPYERTIGGVRSAWLAGTLNAAYGMILSAGIGAAFFVVVGFAGGLVFRRSGIGEILGVAGGVVTLCLANFFCAKSLFYSVYRISDEPDEAKPAVVELAVAPVEAAPSMENPPESAA